jgi:hypothetical protein
MKTTIAPITVGSIIRYGTAPSALMQVELVAFNHGGAGEHRYYGKQCYGGSQGANHSHCRLASSADLETWNTERLRA